MNVRSHLIHLIVESSEGNVSESDLSAAGGSLSAFNYSSLSYIRLIDAIENELGVYIDPDADAESFTTLDGIVALVAQSLDGADV